MYWPIGTIANSAISGTLFERTIADEKPMQTRKLIDPAEDGPEVLVFLRERLCALLDAIEIVIDVFPESAL